MTMCHWPQCYEIKTATLVQGEFFSSRKVHIYDIFVIQNHVVSAWTLDAKLCEVEKIITSYFELHTVVKFPLGRILKWALACSLNPFCVLFCPLSSPCKFALRARYNNVVNMKKAKELQFHKLLWDNQQSAFFVGHCPFVHLALGSKCQSAPWIL